MTNTPMTVTVAEFLTDLTRAGKSANTVRAYRSDLRDFARFFTGPIDQITAGVLRQYLGSVAGKAPATGPGAKPRWPACWRGPTEPRSSPPIR